MDNIGCRGPIQFCVRAFGLGSQSAFGPSCAAAEPGETSGIETRLIKNRKNGP